MRDGEFTPEFRQLLQNFEYQPFIIASYMHAVAQEEDYETFVKFYNLLTPDQKRLFLPYFINLPEPFNTWVHTIFAKDQDIDLKNFVKSPFFKLELPAYLQKLYLEILYQDLYYILEKLRNDLIHLEEALSSLEMAQDSLLALSSYFLLEEVALDIQRVKQMIKDDEEEKALVKERLVRLVKDELEEED